MARKKVNNLIGLDIGSDSLKLLKINSSEIPYKVENFSIATLPSDAIVKGEIKNSSVIANVLKNMVRQAGVTATSFALAIPRSSTIIKTITIDSRLTTDEIESRAWIEANHHFPDLVGDIYLDFFIQGHSSQDPSQLELILVACRKDQVNPYLEILKFAGLDAKIIDVNSYALERSLSTMVGNTELKTIALLNLDFNLSTFIVLQDKNLIYAHDQSFDGRRIINQAQEYSKENKNVEEDAKYLDMLKDIISAHLRHTIHFFYSSRPNISIEKIFLSGDCAMIPGLAFVIQREIGVETVVADPFGNMILNAKIDEVELKKNGPSLMLCCGLALSQEEQIAITGGNHAPG